MNRIIRSATIDDIEVMADVVEAGVAETDVDVIFDRQETREHLWCYLHDNNTDILLGELNDDLVGGAMLAASHEFYKWPFCYLAKFWVLPAGRRQGMAHDLVHAVIDWGRERDCSHIYRRAAPGHGPRPGSRRHRLGT